ncbi:CBASS cGAMP synthase [Dechloromonas hortensis]|uniref:CBASS cGAMP synthase n=1 Tax=Dechloromonas hortensis TaxID=337779 RepID=UPI001291E1C8|nr:hypothetical protein [Dechloromonas hortensis]
MLNLSSLFYSSVDEVSLLTNIELHPVRKGNLAESKAEIRVWLKEHLPVALAADDEVKAAVTPRFFTQGSWAYKTLNAPAKKTQQADIDDGAYLPMSFVKETPRPSIASKVFFRAVEETLKPLVNMRGWRLDTSKATCVRVIIAADAHEDIPLYAIPDSEYVKLTEARNRRVAALDAVLAKSEQDVWEALPTQSVLLAHRDDDWIRSDPRPVKDWFVKAVFVHGEQLRRVVRYLKAFRDWQWESGGPASILLMAAAVECYETRERRDDLALLDVVKQLPAILRRGVSNPVDREESLTKRLGKEGVEDTCTKLEQLAKYLEAAIHASEPMQACTWLQAMFGTRFPLLPERVKTESVKSTVQAAPAVAVASPLVGRSKAG